LTLGGLVHVILNFGHSKFETKIHLIQHVDRSPLIKTIQGIDDQSIWCRLEKENTCNSIL